MGDRTISPDMVLPCSFQRGRFYGSFLVPGHVPSLPVVGLRINIRGEGARLYFTHMRYVYTRLTMLPVSKRSTDIQLLSNFTTLFFLCQRPSSWAIKKAVSFDSAFLEILYSFRSLHCLCVTSLERRGGIRITTELWSKGFEA